MAGAAPASTLIDKIEKKHKAGTSRQHLTDIVASLEAWRSEGSSSLADVCSQLRAQCQKVQADNREQQQLHSKLGKSIEKALPPPAALEKALPVEPLPAGHLPTPGHLPTLTHAIFQHLLVTGEVDAAERLWREAGLSDEAPPELIGALREMHAILGALRARDLGSALAWAQAHRAALREAGSRLPFLLEQLAYLQLVDAGKRAEALRHARLRLVPAARDASEVPLCDAMRCDAMRCCAMLCDAVRCFAMLCCAVLRYATLCYAMLCYAMGRVTDGVSKLGVDWASSPKAANACVSRL
jgi:hypothetical protein